MDRLLGELPEGWVEAELADFVPFPKADIVDGPFGSNLKASEYQNSGVPIIRLQNIDRNRFIDKNINYVTSEKAEFLKRHSFEQLDIVITKLGAPLGKAAIIPVNFGPGIIVADVVRCRVDERFADRQYVMFAINSPRVIDQFIGETKGTTRPRVNLKHIRSLRLPMAPLNEQRRIVEKIETLFARLDKGEEAVRQVQTLLARYRQSVLKAAVTGQLTADWRAERRGSLEPGEALLTRILHARREQWQGRGQYKPPTPLNTDNLPTLPEGWVWASVDQVLRDGLTNGRSVPDAVEGFPVLRLTALKDGRIDLSERKTGRWSAEQAAPFLVQPGDILVSRGNGSKALVGRGGLVADVDSPAAFPDTMIRIPVLLDCVSPTWFLQLWNSSYMRAQIEAAAKTTAGIYKINQGDIRSFSFPLPPLEEQLAIAAAVEGDIEKTTQLEMWCGTELKRSASLRQSILRQAFAGRLVPQDPTDEPAATLLDRIKAETAITPKPSRRRKNASA